MAKVKLIVSDPKSGKSQVFELEGGKVRPFIGLRLGETVDGSLVGLNDAKLLLAGGTDKDGFPMRGDVQGGVKTRVLLSRGPGFSPRMEGERRRKTVRGNLITEDVAQLNLKIVEAKQGS